MARIELINVSHSYVAGEYAVKDINLTWEDGVASALLGPSGCGKTTLLKIISGLLRPTEGKVLLDGQDVTGKSPSERNVAQVFQFPIVYDTMSVFDNLAFPLRNRGVGEEDVRRRVHKVAEILDLEPYLGAKAGRLGAAEKQRISLGRGIVREDTSAVLFDEPLTVIDPHLKWHLRRKLKEVHANLGLTMIYVTHDQHEALTFADQVTVMETGRALQTGSPRDLHLEPKAPFVGYFIGSPGMNILEAELDEQGLHIGDYLYPLPPESVERIASIEGSLSVGIRPEFVQLSTTAQEGWFRAQVRATSFTGDSLIASLEGGGQNLKARLHESTSAKSDEPVWINFPADYLKVYRNDLAVPWKATAATGGRP